MDFLELIKEPVFLVSSTVMSIFISITANLLTPKFNQLLSKFSSSRKRRQSEIKSEFVSKVVTAALDANNIINIKLDVAYTLLKALIVIVFGLFILSMSPYFNVIEYFSIFVSFGFVIYAMSLFNKAQTGYKIARLATLRAEKMSSLRAELNSMHDRDDQYSDYIDPEEEMYLSYLAEWDKANL